jgi:hypothetical protein
MSTPTRTPRASAGAPSGSKPPGSKRSQRMQLVVVAVSAGLLVGAALVFFLLARSDGDGGDSSPSKEPVSGNVQLTLAGVQNANAGVPAQLSDDAANQIMTVVGQYVDRGLIAPVKTGKPPEGVSDLFDPGTQAAIQGPDKDVLFENGQPELTGDFKPSADPVLITALSDGNGNFVLATAAFAYRADAGVEGGTLNTGRTIALTLTPDNGWKITGYDLTVTRQGAQVEGSSTAAATQ